MPPPTEYIGGPKDGSVTFSGIVHEAFRLQSTDAVWFHVYVREGCRMVYKGVFNRSAPLEAFVKGGDDEQD